MSIDVYTGVSGPHLTPAFALILTLADAISSDPRSRDPDAAAFENFLRQQIAAGADALTFEGD